MKHIYFDNAATSYPKSPLLSDTITDFINNRCVNVNRGVYSAASESESVVFETREKLANFFDCGDDAVKFSKRIIFTSGVTQSVNMFLRGLLENGDHIVTGSMEHHCVMRTLYSLKEEKGVEFSIANADENGIVTADAVEKCIKENTKAVIINHASNVFGSVSDIEKIGTLCKKHNIFFAVDSAQTAGVIPISVRKCNIDFLAFSGHKGLLSLQGIGGFYISERLEKALSPTITGGTGSFSHLYTQPDVLPDKFESGTPNLCGIYSIKHSLKYLEKTGIENIRKHEMLLRKRFVDGLRDVDGVTLYCADLPYDKSTSTVSINFDNLDNGLCANTLIDEYGIMVREGFHCAMSAHESMKTDKTGTIRFSFSYFNTEEEIDYTINAIKTIAQKSK